MKKYLKGYWENLLNSCLVGALLLNVSSPTLMNVFWENVIDKTFSISLAATIKEVKIPVVATGYSSTPDQTDDTPLYTSTGDHVFDGLVAANFLAFGTKIKIPELYGNKVFIVKDRMNARYNNANPHRLDIWFSNRAQAKKFGLQKVEIIVLNSN